jgi:hypothetical protein
VKPAKRCVYCKTDLSAPGVESTVEHIIPKWLQKEWNMDERNLAPTHYDEKGNIISMRHHGANAFVSGRVCAKCNNGWMSVLETEARSLILDLAAGRRRVLDLADPDALLLARWAVKTAWALQAGSNYRRMVPDDHYRVLDSAVYKLPDGVRVVAHGYKSGRDFAWVQGPTWHCISEKGLPPSDMALLHDTGYKIGLKLGGLLLLVYYNPLPHTRDMMTWLKHIPIYPRSSHPVMWLKHEGPWPSREMVRFYVFVQSLGIVWGADEPGSEFARPEGAAIKGPTPLLDYQGNPMPLPKFEKRRLSPK